MLEMKLIELCKDASDGQVATEYQSTTAHALKLSLSHLPQFTCDEHEKECTSLFHLVYS